MTQQHFVSYRIISLCTRSHYYDLSLEISDPDPSGQQLSLPTWIPGSYLIREFARNVLDISAKDAQGNPVFIEKINKNTWRAAPCDGALFIQYRIYAFDLSVRSAWLDSERGFFNCSSLCLEVIGASHLPCYLEICPQLSLSHWRVGTSMEAVRIDAHGWGLYRANSYSDLIDFPVELADFQTACFQVAGVSHRLILSGRVEGDVARLASDLQKICQAQVDFFGGTPPFEQYVFMLYLGEGLYGGLEHRDSTALMADPKCMPKQGQSKISDDYLELLALCSHEYFHAWNVKRIIPAQFCPYDLNTENYTKLLWAFEGITSYYDDLFVLRAQLIDTPRYLTQIARTVSGVAKVPGRFHQTLESSSFDTWIKLYRPDENTPNSAVSYYQKGALVALALDLTIRQATNEEKSLDTVMQALWARAQAGMSQIAETEWELVAQQVTGISLVEFFDHALRRCEDLPLEALLKHFGIKMEWAAASSSSDRGGWRTEAPAESAGDIVSLGAKLAPDAVGLKVTHVLDGGALQNAGVSAGDILIAADGIRLRDVDSWLQKLTPGQQVSLMLFRRERVLQCEMLCLPAPLDTCWLSYQALSGAWPAN